MELKNPLRKKKVPHLSLTKEKPKLKEKKDWFGASLIVFTGVMIGALIAYLIVTFT